MTGAPRILPELALSRSALDRSGWLRGDAGLVPRLLDDEGTQVVVSRGDLLQARADGSALVLHRPVEVRVTAEDLVVYLGADEGGGQYLGVARDPMPDASGPGDPARDGAADEPSRWLGLRSLGLTLDPLDVALASTLAGISNWHRAHRFCSRCGLPTAVNSSGWVRRCPEGHESYPVTSPAVIMAVVDRQDRLLLARNASWPEGRLSVLAGFVEPGESLEVAVAREVKEEVGLEVEAVEYAGNQPWPFPASLMLAFTARARDGQLRFADDEIAEARWYSRDELRADIRAGAVLSGGTPISVAYHLVERWLGEPIAALQDGPPVPW
ncbi:MULTISPECIES: NAD(+) diphosphatase [Arsenicicoccus]|uniref:NAD(+) diphosphatase n=1 Tax=Arsenicicoccus bolidensis TaxID=229480 RepID=A0ABS9Q2G4_9MICO|nr:MULTISPECIES: NAD(+) diphosphatase [Arsenicicoccus]MCG7321455.1 NAD(+) diphosphatase [Arsenicicoccus bolidensis]